MKRGRIAVSLEALQTQIHRFRQDLLCVLNFKYGRRQPSWILRHAYFPLIVSNFVTISATKAEREEN